MSDININDMALANEMVSYDPDAEYNPTRVVPDGTYLMKLTLGKPRPNQESAIIFKTTSGGKPYLDVQVTGQIIAPSGKFDNFFVHGTINSLVFASNSSAVHQMLKSVGQAPPASHTLGQLKELVESALGGGAQCNVRTRWEASTKNSDGATEKYLNVRGMRKFPVKPDGSYDPNYTFTLENGEEVTKEARPNFADFQPAVASNGHSG